MPYCPKCGKEVKEDAVFCPYCGQSLKPEDKVVYRRHRDEKNEKGEKNEKNEKNEKDSRGEKAEKGEKNEGSGAMWGAVMGGLIVLWLGVTFLFRQYGYIGEQPVVELVPRRLRRNNNPPRPHALRPDEQLARL